MTNHGSTVPRTHRVLQQAETFRHGGNGPRARAAFGYIAPAGCRLLVTNLTTPVTGNSLETMSSWTSISYRSGAHCCFILMAGRLPAGLTHALSAKCRASHPFAIYIFGWSKLATRQ